jgi:hypothetical protein
MHSESKTEREGCTERYTNSQRLRCLVSKIMKGHAEKDRKETQPTAKESERY